MFGFSPGFSASRKSLLDPEGKETNEAFAGLPSLSPSVTITRKHDDILLNGQSPELANRLELGNVWFLTKDFAVPDSAFTWTNGKNHAQDLEESTENMEFARNSSDPYLAGSSLFADKSIMSRSSSFSPTSKSSKLMGNLKKLFANQLELPTAMTPSDQCLCKSLLVSSFVIFCFALAFVLNALLHC